MQSALGFGQSLLLAPGLLAATDPGDAVLAALLLALLANALVLGTERRPLEVDRPRAGRFVAAGLPGMVAGVVVLRAVNRPVLQVAAGAVVLLALAASARSGTRKARPPGRSWAAYRPGDLAAGAAAGVLNTTTSLSGPPLVLALAGAPPATQRDTITAALLTLNLGGALLLLLAGTSADGDGAALALALSPAVLLGHRAGRAAFERLDDQAFARAATALIAAAGVASVAAGLIG